MAKRLVAFIGGEDVSVNFAHVPEGADLSSLKKKYDRWYRDSYLPAMHLLSRQPGAHRPMFYTFCKWLIAFEGAETAEVEEFEDV